MSFGQTAENLHLMIVQNRAIRNILNLPFYTPVKDLYIISKIPPLSISAELRAVMLIYKIKHNTILYNTHYTLNSDKHSYGTRHAEDLALFYIHSSKYGRNSFKFSASKSFNELPTEVKSAPTLSSFKRKTMRILWEKFNAH